PDPRLKELEAKSEAAYFAEQASRTSDLIQKLGWPLAIAMAFGALAGALNTMYSSVAARTTEIATLRAIGFGGLPAFVGTLTESLILATIGGVLGAAATFLTFNGLSAATLGASFTQVVFSFELTPALAAEGVSHALIVGLLGGIFPSIRAARMPILAGLYGRQHIEIRFVAPISSWAKSAPRIDLSFEANALRPPQLQHAVQRRDNRS